LHRSIRGYIDVPETYKSSIIFGDTNINYYADNRKKNQLQILLKTFNLKQVIDLTTRIGSYYVLLIVYFWIKVG